MSSSIISSFDLRSTPLDRQKSTSDNRIIVTMATADVAGRKKIEFAKLKEALAARDALFNPDDRVNKEHYRQENPNIEYWNGRLRTASESTLKAWNNFLDATVKIKPVLEKLECDVVSGGRRRGEKILLREYYAAEQEILRARDALTFLEKEFQVQSRKVNELQLSLMCSGRQGSSEDIPDSVIHHLIEKERAEARAVQEPRNDLANLPDADPVPPDAARDFNTVQVDASPLPAQYLSLPSYSDYETDYGKKELLAEAIQYFDQLKDIESVKCTLSKTSSDRDVLEDIYREQGFEGLCVGERHDQAIGNNFIFDNLPILKELGVNTIFTEYFKYEHQKDLDYYFKTGEMTPALRAFVEEMDNTYPLALSEKLWRAAEAGIRIVGIDSDACKGLSQNRVTRRLRLHYLAERIIHHEKGRGKYIALMGINHGSQVIGETYREKSPPGIAELLQCPLITFLQGSKKEIVLNRQADPVKGGLRHVHLHVEIPDTNGS